MTQPEKKKYTVKPLNLIVILLIITGVFLLDRYMSFDRLRKNHTGKEMRIGDREVNRQLYLYLEQNQTDKYIVTDYQYLYLLPDISKHYKYGIIQEIKPDDPLLSDQKVGFLLLSTLFDSSNQLPAFIQDSIQAGKYKEIFNTNNCIFIKIR